jgi:GTP-binding protein
MIIKSAEFLVSNTNPEKCPIQDKPEYAFIGRSNVGKSSLINMLVNQKSLAKTSGRPGKTQLINHFGINGEWFLVDLPGYGFARVSKDSKAKWESMIKTYLTKRTNLMTVFLLIDSRLEAQKIDLEFMNWLGEHNIPFTIVFTKADKQSRPKTDSLVAAYKKEILKTWEEVPPLFISSADDGTGKAEILDYIESVNPLFAINN